MKIEKGKIKKIIRIMLLNCIYIIIGLCFLYNIIFVINTTITKNDYLKLFGISLFNMQTNLMQDDINENDLVIVKEVTSQELQEGDIIAYTINGKTRINKIINKKEEYTTKSNKNYHPDIEKVANTQVIGKMVGKLAYFGVVIQILQSKLTNILIFVLLILYFFYNRYTYTMKRNRARKKRTRSQITRVKRDRVPFCHFLKFC